MSVTELKERIREAVDSIENKEHLETILATTGMPFRKDEEPLTNEELSMVNERKEEYLKGEPKLTTWREAHQEIKDMHGLTEKEIAILKRREKALMSGEAKLIPWKEVDAKIRAKHGF